VNEVTVAVVGLGWFGERHCEALSGIPHVELHALCTRTESRPKEVAKTFGVKKTRADYNRLLADPNVDAISVGTLRMPKLSLVALPSQRVLQPGKPATNFAPDSKPVFASKKY